MQANVRLLEHLISCWDHALKTFDLQGEILEIDVEGMSFITGLSRRGIPVNLKGTRRGGDPMSVQDYVDTHCMLGNQKRDHASRLFISPTSHYR